MKKRRGSPGSFSQSRGQFSTPRFHIPNACPREKRTKKLVWVITSAAKPRPPSGLWKDRSQAEPPDKYWKGDLVRHKKCYSWCLISSTALSHITKNSFPLHLFDFRSFFWNWSLVLFQFCIMLWVIFLIREMLKAADSAREWLINLISIKNLKPHGIQAKYKTTIVRMSEILWKWRESL